jgi:hypothetical protein
MNIERPNMDRLNPTIYFGDVEEVTPEALVAILEKEKEEMRKTYLAAKGAFIHSSGITVTVDKRVSRDLELTVTEKGLVDVPLLGTSLLFKWADTALPEILLKLRRDDEGRFWIHAAMDFRHSAKPDRFAYYLYTVSGKRADEIFDPNFEVSTGDVEENDRECSKYLVRLAFMVMAYASIPAHKPKPVLSRQEAKELGIHPKHIHGPIVSVRHLPKVIRDETSGGPAETTGREREFKGRAGVLRYYKDDRYVNVRGTWQLLPPIVPPEGVKVIYRIRKPK